MNELLEALTRQKDSLLDLSAFLLDQRAAIAGRDLEAIEEFTASYPAILDSLERAARDTLADASRFAGEEVTRLSQLLERVPPESEAGVLVREIRLLAHRVEREMGTNARLLRRIWDFNQRILRVVSGDDPEALTYAGDAVRRQSKHARFIERTA